MALSPSTRAMLSRWAALPLRLIVGGGFMVHGYLKLGRGVEGFAAAGSSASVQSSFSL
jgi:putative oxidoreductase